LRILTSILFTIAVFTQTFNAFVIETVFLLNRGYIAKVLCINKEKPKLHCNGHCYLAKQLKEQDASDRQAPAEKKEKPDLQPFCVPMPFTFCSLLISAKEPYQHSNHLERETFARSIFHPPTA